MIWIAATTLALAAPPVMEGAWKKGAVWLTLQPPAGEHLNEDGPLSGWISIDGSRLEVGGAGALLASGLPVASARGMEVSGTLSVPLCEDSGGACRVVSVSFCGTPTRSLAALASTEPPPPPGPAPHAESVEDAFAQAASQSKLVLLDFGAVWCPPCNLLNAELLEDPEDADALAGYVLVAIDADDASSWSVKDRYSIGGYPTVVITRPDGSEIDRMVGYPGETQTLDWLAGAPGATALSALPEPAASDEAATIALRLVRQGDDEAAAAWLAVAPSEDTADFRLARLSLTPTADDVHWLIEDGAPIADWVWDASSLAEEDAALKEALLISLRAALSGAEPLLAADLLWVAAGLSDDTTAQTLYAAGASALSVSLTGDPEMDRGQWSFLSQLHERAGNLDAGLAVLTRGAAHYPEEFTFHHAAAGMFLRAERLDEALTSSEAAVQHSYGDNALRAAKRKAEILHARQQTDEALALIDATLESAVRPDETLKVRTSRYITALETLRAELAQ